METPEQRKQRGHQSLAFMAWLIAPFLAIPLLFIQPLGLYVWLVILILWGVSLTIGIFSTMIYDMYHDDGGMM